MTPLVSVNSLCLGPGTLAHHAEYVGRLGAAGIGVTVEEVQEAGAAQARALLRDTGLIASTMTHRAFAFASPDQVGPAREKLMRSIDLASEIGALSLTMTTGGRGDLCWDEAANRFSGAIAPSAEAARQAGVALALEPTSHLYADASIAHRLSDLVTIARMAEINLGIDIFACWFDSDIDRAIVAAVPLCRLVQVSDYVGGDRSLPCRAVPGDGIVPLHRLLPAIVDAGYAGWFDIEVIGPRLTDEGIAKGLHRALTTIRFIVSMPRME